MNHIPIVERVGTALIPSPVEFPNKQGSGRPCTGKIRQGLSIVPSPSGERVRVRAKFHEWGNWCIEEGSEFRSWFDKLTMSGSEPSTHSLVLRILIQTIIE